MMRLDLYDNSEFDRGASRVKELCWIIVSGLAFSTWLPGSGWRCWLLKAFGARIGAGVVLKPNVSIKFPWKLTLGDHVWIGERVWIDNLDQVTIGNHSCLSQGAYLCTGSHDWTKLNFALITKPITIGNFCWVGAHASMAPGSTMADGAILAMKAFGSGNMKANQIYLGNEKRRTRRVACGDV
ncbi:MULTISPECIES: WcaF family extracellular polysaccharide biosynthesis acetyltransferase [Pseudomonadota]|uniref:WcaF family extracellular polysaccharide biosynthesis acetyltransferase n=1 Tax=Pseudomonadota TaxID=1224 RepID=UPI003A910EC6